MTFFKKKYRKLQDTKELPKDTSIDSKDKYKTYVENAILKFSS